MEFVHQPAPSNRIGDYLKDNLAGRWTHFRAAVAFVKRSGVRHIAPALTAFARTGHAEIVAGIDHRGTSSEGLRDLLYAVSPRGRIIVFHNRLPFTFHPKVYLFKSSAAAEVLVGSGNLTEGGLFTNYEASLRLSLDLADPKQAKVLQSLERVLDSWADLSTGAALVLDEALLARITGLGLVPSEALAVSEPGDMERGIDKIRPGRTGLPFAARGEYRAPPFPRPGVVPEASTTETVQASPTPTPTSQAPATFSAAGFVMTLQRTDVGVGQTTAGASRRSPEIFIPLGARDADPDFWSWPAGFVPDPGKPGKLDRRGVRVRLGSETISMNMMTWPDKHDFRLRSEALRSAGNVGDILRMEKVEPGSGYEYYAEVVPQGTSQHPVYLALCRRPVRNSRKRYGYY